MHSDIFVNVVAVIAMVYSDRLLYGVYLTCVPTIQKTRKHLNLLSNCCKLTFGHGS